MAKASESKELKTNSGALVSEAAYDYGDYAGAGFDNQSRDDYSIPFLGVLQAISPQLETLDDAKAGMLINTVSSRLWKSDEGLCFVPCWTDHVYVEWKPRKEGGGFVGQHALDSEIVAHCKANQEFGEFVTPEGNDLTETFYVYGLIVHEDGTVEQAAVAFASTKIKVYKKWMTKAKLVQIALPNGQRINPPLFAHKYRLTTVKEKNNQGEYWNLDVEWDGANAAAARIAPTEVLFQEAVATMEIFKAGAAKIDYGKQGGSTDSGEKTVNQEQVQERRAAGGKAPF